MEKMRLVVLVDLPTATRHERKVARVFREWLFANGYSTLQEGVFTRTADGRDSADAHSRKLHVNRPETGSVRLFTMTESQFRNGLLVAGEESSQELEIGAQLDIFL